MPVPLEILDEEFAFLPRLQLDACQLVCRRFLHRIEARAGVLALHPISSFGIFPDERTDQTGNSSRSFYLQAIYTEGKFVMLFNDEGDANKLVGFMMYLRNAYVHKKLAFDFVHLPTITPAQAEALSAVQCRCRMLSLENVTGTLEVIEAVLSAISVKEEVHITTCNDEVVSAFLSTFVDSPPTKATVEYPVVPSKEVEALDDYYIRHLLAMSKFNGKSSLSVFNYYPQMDFFDKLLGLFKSTSCHQPAAFPDSKL
ncbi:hypothetical protein AAVH_02306 [Aphelenchoides avenae]|nr:hypothetical protein AAVH_02306 [Aphelenchus avenae]